MSSMDNWKFWLKNQIKSNGEQDWDLIEKSPSVFSETEEEYQFLESGLGLIDQSRRGRICLLGEDRVRFLNGQITNQLDSLPTGYGVLAGLVNAKGKLEADLRVYVLRDELLLDFEPGLTEKITQRLEKYIIADDVEVVDVTGDYGSFSLLGPLARQALLNHPGIQKAPDTELGVEVITTKNETEWVVIRNSRWGFEGYDILAPWDELIPLADHFTQFAKVNRGGWIGETAQDIHRIEAGWPKYGVDMDESNLAPETGLEKSAISYNKGCYIGQEVIARIRTYGQVAKSLRGFWLPEEFENPPPSGTELYFNGKKVGYLTSLLKSSKYGRWIALGYARKECNKPGSALKLGSAEAEFEAMVVSLPFQPVQDQGWGTD